jgi:hypothetical protein
VYTPEDVQKAVEAAEDAERANKTPLTHAWASFICYYRDARGWCDQKLNDYTGAPAVRWHAAPRSATCMYSMHVWQASASAAVSSRG